MMIFRHQSPNFYKTLKPVSYNQINKNRDNDEYSKDRLKTEKEYHKLLNDDQDSSFIYATIVGFHKMQSASKYPGYTYYFKLTSKEIENSLFQVVGQEKHTTKMIKGRKGLLTAIKYWLEHESELKPYYDKIVGGNIDPRIEVIINQPVEYFKYIPQVEDR